MNNREQKGSAWPMTQEPTLALAQFHAMLISDFKAESKGKGQTFDVPSLANMLLQRLGSEMKGGFHQLRLQKAVYL